MKAYDEWCAENYGELTDEFAVSDIDRFNEFCKEKFEELKKEGEK